MKRLFARMAFELLLRCMPTEDVHLAAATTELATALEGAVVEGKQKIDEIGRP